MPKACPFCFLSNFIKKMTQLENQLWQKISTFQLDDPNAKLTFSGRLARENGWGKEYTIRVIEEYLKFIFLCCVSTKAITPSDPVDQAWHLHLTYTHSYWNDLCKKTLIREIHHNPTKGGISEKQKFNSCYTRLEDIYKEKFGYEPPRDIWQDNKTRFSDMSFQRVNINRYWLIKKPKFTKEQSGQLLAMASAILFIQAPAGLLFFFTIMVLFIIIGVIINKNNKNGGNGSTDGCSACFTSNNSSG